MCEEASKKGAPPYLVDPDAHCTIILFCRRFFDDENQTFQSCLVRLNTTALLSQHGNRRSFAENASISINESC